jgi:hypothetical protein
MGGTFNQHQALSSHSPKGKLPAAIDRDRAAIGGDVADYRLLLEVAHPIADKHFVKADFPRKRSTHGCLMLAPGSQAASYSASLSDICPPGSRAQWFALSTVGSIGPISSR